VNYCYDNADRLTSTSVGNGPTGPDPLLAGNLSASNVTYDSQGNTTKLADESLAYDASGNNISTTLSDGTAVSYVRDAGGNIVQRSATVGGVASTIRYSGQFILDGTSSMSVVEQDLSLPGGVTVAIPATGSQSWSYPDLHGDNIVQADGAGARVGGLASYDPFGQPVDPTTGGYRHGYRG
jgi:YD repeat-containing protein